MADTDGWTLSDPSQTSGWTFSDPAPAAPDPTEEEKPRSWFDPMSHVDHFMEDTANLRDPSIHYGIGDTQFNDGTTLSDYFNSNKDNGTLKKVALHTLDDITGVVGRLGMGVGDTVNYLGHVIGGDYGGSTKEGWTPNDIIGQALAPFGGDVGLMHVPEGYVAPEARADIVAKIKGGATTDEIMADHPNLNRSTVEANVQAVKNKYKGPITFKDPPQPEHTQYSPDELSGKRPEVHPPINPTVDTTHVDPISETDETGTYHPVNIRNPDTGEVVSDGRAYVDPDTGAPQGSVLAHPLTKENHTVTPATQGVIESKLPGGDPEAHLTPSDNALTPPIKSTYEAKPLDDGSNIGGFTVPPGSTHSFKYTTSDGKVVEGGYRLNDQGEMHSLSIGDVDNPIDLGHGETMNLIRSIANEHPEVNTIYAKRTSGANPGRDMVYDAQKLRDRTVPDGTTQLQSTPVKAADDNVAPTEPPKPTPNVNTDQYAGNINKDRLLDENGQPVNPSVRSELDQAADRIGDRQSLGNTKTRKRAWELIDQHGEEALLSPTAFQKFDHPDELVAWPVAVRNIINKRAIQFSRAKQAAGGATLTQEQATALSQHENALTDAVDKGMDVIQVGPRMTQSGHIMATPEELTPEEWQAVKDNAKKAVVDSGGNPAVIDQVMKDSQTEKGRSLLGQAWYSGLLSNWQTHFHYAQGLGLQNLVDLVHHGIGSVLDQPGRLVTANDFPRIYGREVIARAWGSASGAINAVLDVGRKIGQGVQRVVKDLPGDESTEANLVSGISSIPTSVIGTIGDIAKQAGAQGELYARSMRNAIKDSPESSNRSALNTIIGVLKDNSSGFGNAPETDVMTRYRENLENPSEDDLEAADKHGKMLSLEDDPSPVTAGMKRLQFALDVAAQNPNNPIWTRGPAMAMSTVGRVLLPFISRTDAVIRSGIRNGLLGQIPGLDRYNTQLMIDASKGDAHSRSLLDGKAILAGGVTAALVMKALNGQLTGSMPSDQAERDQFIQEGKIPQAYLGDDGKWHSVAGITPLASNLTMVADAVDKYKKDEDYHDWWRTSTDIAGSILHSLADPMWLGTLEPLFDNANHNNRVASTIAGLAGTVVPAGVRAANQTYFDPVARDTSGSNILERSENQIKSSIPGLSQTLPARTDTLGRPIVKEKGLTETSTPDRDPVTNEIERLGKNGAAVVKAAGEAWTGYTTDEDGDDISKKVPFTPEQYREYVQKSGDYIRRDFASAMSDPEYQNMSEYKKLKTLREVIKGSRANARDEILDRDNRPVGSWTLSDGTSKGWTLSDNVNTRGKK